MPIKSLNQKGVGAVEAVLVVLIVAILGGTGYYVYHANKNTNDTLSSAAKDANGSPKFAANIKTFAECKKAAGSEMRETSPEVCVTKDGKMFTAQTPNGTITGTLGYPSEGNPAQKVCAVLTADAAKSTCVTMQDGYATYTVGVAPGDYYVYASLIAPLGDFTPSYKAYYDQFSKCGANARCSEAGHKQYIVVTVSEGQTVFGVDPTDWYNKAN